MNAVVDAGRPSEREENQLVVHKGVGERKGRVRRNVTKATADVSKPEHAKGEGWSAGGVLRRGNKSEGGRKVVMKG